MSERIYDAGTLARAIDHTLLKPEATTEDIQQLCNEALDHKFYSVCVNSRWVSVCKDILGDSGVKISAVCGFPLGAVHTATKTFEASVSAANGAEEIDMVLPIGLLIEGKFDTVASDIRQVVEAVRGQAIVKVILETGFLNDEQKRAGCRIALEAGAAFVKTSTGFGPGGATVADIRLMREAVGPEMGVKASGGIRDTETAILMLEAGANRLGTSSGVAIVQGSASSENY